MHEQPVFEPMGFFKGTAHSETFEKLHDLEDSLLRLFPVHFRQGHKVLGFEMFVLP